MFTWYIYFDKLYELFLTYWKQELIYLDYEKVYSTLNINTHTYTYSYTYKYVYVDLIASILFFFPLIHLHIQPFNKCSLHTGHLLCPRH